MSLSVLPVSVDGKNTCPADATLAMHAEQQLDTAGREFIDGHLEHCEDCDMAAAILRSAVASRGLRSDSESDTTPSLAAFIGRARLARELTPGSLLGRFRIVRRLGMGAMGVVVAAHDPELDRGVALKVLFDDECARDSRRRVSDRSVRLRREARSMARLNHPNAVTVYEVDASQERVFLAMELVVGTTLREWLQSKPRLLDVVRLFERVALAVHAGHQAGIVHRDLKPQNILVTQSGEPKVTDFGLARASATDLEQSGALIGTPSYMAPEALDGRAAGPAADQFALAVCVHEALCGLRPYRAESVEALRSRMRIQPSHALDRSISAPLRAVLARALAYEPTARFPTVLAFGKALADTQPKRAPTFGSLALVGLATAVAFVTPAADVVHRGTTTSADSRLKTVRASPASAAAMLAEGSTDAAPPRALAVAAGVAPGWQGTKRGADARARPDRRDAHRTDQATPGESAPSASGSEAKSTQLPATETPPASTRLPDWKRSRL